MIYVTSKKMVSKEWKIIVYCARTIAIMLIPRAILIAISEIEIRPSHLCLFRVIGFTAAFVM